MVSQIFLHCKNSNTPLRELRLGQLRSLEVARVRNCPLSRFALSVGCQTSFCFCSTLNSVLIAFSILLLCWLLVRTRSFPAELVSQDELRWLELIETGITGALPSGPWQLDSLKKVDLRGNNVGRARLSLSLAAFVSAFLLTFLLPRLPPVQRFARNHPRKLLQ